MKINIDKKGYSLLEIIVGITIFSIFSASIALAFSTYTEVSNKNNLIAFERVKIISKLEEFLATGKYDKNKDKKSKLIIEKGFKEISKEIEIFEREEISDKSKETMKAFVKSNEKNKN